MPGGVRGIACPQPLALPPGLRIVHAAVGRSREEAERVGHPQRHELPRRRLNDLEGIGVVRSVDGSVFPQAQDVVHVHVREIALVRVERAAVERRIVLAVERPPFRAALAAGLRVFGAPAFRPVECREMAAVAPVLPDDAVVVGFDAAGSEDLDRLVRRRLVELRLAGARRIGAALEPHEALRAPADSRAPEAVVLRVHGHRVAAELDPMILRGIDRLIGLGPALRNPPVTVGVEHGRTPPLRCLGIVGLLPGVHVDPTDCAIHAEEDVVVRIKHVVIGGEAGVDVLVLVQLLVVLRHLAAAGAQRIVRRELVRARRAERRLLLRFPRANRQPELAVLIDGGAPHVGGPPPHVLSPEWRGGRRRVECGHQRRSRGQDLDVPRSMLERVQHRERVGHLGHAVDRPVGVGRRNARVARHVVRASVGWRAPIPHRDDEVPFETGRPRRDDLRRLSSLHAIGEVGKGFPCLTEIHEEAPHRRT